MEFNRRGILKVLSSSATLGLLPLYQIYNQDIFESNKWYEFKTYDIYNYIEIDNLTNTHFFGCTFNFYNLGYMRFSNTNKCSISNCFINNFTDFDSVMSI